MICYKHISEKEARSVNWEDAPCVNVATGATFLGAFDDMRLVGIVAYKKRGDTIKLCSAIVQPTYRRKGIYSALYDLREKEIASIPHKREVAYCTNKSVRMLLRHGFQIVKQYKRSTKVEKYGL